MKIINQLSVPQTKLLVRLVESKDRHGKYYAIFVYPNGIENKERLTYLRIYDVLPNSEEVARKSYEQWYITFTLNKERIYEQ